ncbi:MAG: lipase maturation factor family protein [Halobacteria archaeon]
MWFHGNEYWLTRFIFQRGLALIYFLAFLNAVNQYVKLCGEDGLTKLGENVGRWSFSEKPGLLQKYTSDTAVKVVSWTGLGLSFLMLLGFPYLLPQGFSTPASMFLWAILYVLYLSLVNAGGVFYGFGWESMLLETGFFAIFLGSGATATPILTVLLLRWVLFRNMFGAGLIKIRGDSCWRDLTCMDYHYETQPIPNPVSWFVHHLPSRFHKFEVLGNHFVELLIPFLYFAPQPLAAGAGIVTILFQLWLMVTGNFSWLNALTIVLAIPTINDSVITGLTGISSPAVTVTPLYLSLAVLSIAILTVILSVKPVKNMVSSKQVMNTSFNPLRIVNTYGAFGSITKTRYEIVIEGTREETPTDDSDWKEYCFKGKPTDVSRRPRQIAPYHLRLDWQMWFAAMSPRPTRHPWFTKLMEKILEGEQDILGLLAHNPFPDEPPEKLRAVRYRYRFSSPKERRETGDWWRRERLNLYYGPKDKPQYTSSPVDYSMTE